MHHNLINRHFRELLITASSDGVNSAKKDVRSVVFRFSIQGPGPEAKREGSGSLIPLNLYPPHFNLSLRYIQFFLAPSKPFCRSQFRNVVGNVVWSSLIFPLITMSLYLSAGKAFVVEDVESALDSAFSKFKSHIEVLRILDSSAKEWKAILATMDELQSVLKDVGEGVRYTATRYEESATAAQEANNKAQESLSLKEEAERALEGLKEESARAQEEKRDVERELRHKIDALEQDIVAK